MTAAFHLNLLISLILSRNLETALCSCIQPVLRKNDPRGRLKETYNHPYWPFCCVLNSSWHNFGGLLCSSVNKYKCKRMVSISEAHVSSCKLLFEVWRDRSISLMRINNIFYFTGVHKNYSTCFSLTSKKFFVNFSGNNAMILMENMCLGGWYLWVSTNWV